MFELEYLGVGGWLMRWRGTEIATAPCFSNPSFTRVAFGRIESKRELVDRFFPRSVVKAIIAGHSHYDHLLDVTDIAKRFAPSATIFGNRTMRNILGAALPGERLVAVEEFAGQWVHIDETVRFMPLISEHAPHFLGLKFFCGEVTSPLARLPDRANGWKEGQTLAFVIEFLHADGSVAFRLHYQDAASTPPLGFPPPEQTDFDVAITCLASFSQVSGYPDAILQRLRPEHVIAGHWEDFFRPRTEPLRVVPLSDAEAFARRVQLSVPDARYHKPEPGSTLGFEVRRPPSQGGR